jgi:hypothetical protein
MGRIRGKRMFYGNGRPIRVDSNCLAEFNFNEGTGSITADAQDWSTKVATMKNEVVWTTPTADEKSSIEILQTGIWGKTATQVRPPYIPTLDGATNYIDCGVFDGFAFSFALEVNFTIASFSTSTANAFTLIAGKWDEVAGRTFGLVLCTTVNGGDLNQVGIVMNDKATDKTYLGAVSVEEAITAGEWYSVRLNYLDGVPEIIINSVAKDVNDVYNTPPIELTDNDTVPITVGAALASGSPVLPTPIKVATATYYKRPPESGGNYATHRRVSRSFSDNIIGWSTTQSILNQHQYLSENIVETSAIQSMPGDHHHFIRSMYESIVGTDTRSRNTNIRRTYADPITMNAVGNSDLGSDTFSRLLYETMIGTDTLTRSIWHNSQSGSAPHSESDILTSTMVRKIKSARTPAQSAYVSDTMSSSKWHSTMAGHNYWQSEILTDIMTSTITGHAAPIQSQIITLSSTATPSLFHTTAPSSNWHGDTEVLTAMLTTHLTTTYS